MGNNNYTLDEKIEKKNYDQCSRVRAYVPLLIKNMWTAVSALYVHCLFICVSTMGYCSECTVCTVPVHLCEHNGLLQ